MQLKAKKAFSWAHRGCEIRDYAVGEVIDTDDKDLISVATEEGWVERPAVESKAKKAAPENK